MITATETSVFRQFATREAALFVVLLFVGLVVLPLIVFFVGQLVFGSYGGVGYNDFFATLSGKVRHGDYVAWFLVLSPYFGWQTLRLMMFAWRLAGDSKP